MLSKNGLTISIPLFALFALMGVAKADEMDVLHDTAGICPYGEDAVITHPGDATVIRCRPEFALQTPSHSTPIGHVHAALPSMRHVSRVRHSPRPKRVIEVLTAIFRPHTGI